MTSGVGILKSLEPVGEAFEFLIGFPQFPLVVSKILGAVEADCPVISLNKIIGVEIPCFGPDLVVADNPPVRGHGIIIFVILLIQLVNPLLLFRSQAAAFLNLFEVGNLGTGRAALRLRRLILFLSLSTSLFLSLSTSLLLSLSTSLFLSLLFLSLSTSLLLSLSTSLLLSLGLSLRSWSLVVPAGGFQGIENILLPVNGSLHPVKLCLVSTIILSIVTLLLQLVLRGLNSGNVLVQLIDRDSYFVAVSVMEHRRIGRLDNSI